MLKKTGKQTIFLTARYIIIISFYYYFSILLFIIQVAMILSFVDVGKARRIIKVKSIVFFYQNFCLTKWARNIASLLYRYCWHFRVRNKAKLMRRTVVLYIKVDWLHSIVAYWKVWTHECCIVLITNTILYVSHLIIDRALSILFKNLHTSAIV